MTENRFVSEDDCYGYYTEIIDNEKELDLSLHNPKKNLTIEELVDLLNAFYNENEQLKQQINKLEAQLYCPFDSICIKCNNEYLVQKEYYYVSKCKKGHEQCSKVDVKYCEDFEVKELQE